MRYAQLPDSSPFDRVIDAAKSGLSTTPDSKHGQSRLPSACYVGWVIQAKGKRIPCKDTLSAYHQKASL